MDTKMEKQMSQVSKSQRLQENSLRNLDPLLEWQLYPRWTLHSSFYKLVKLSFHKKWLGQS